MSLALPALLLVSVLWGTTFVAVKTGLRDASPLLFVGLRFSIAALAAVPLLRGRGAEARAAWKAGIPLGVVLAIAYSAQTLGLEQLDATSEWLVQVVAERNRHLILLNADPLRAPPRVDSRHGNLVRQVDPELPKG